jgi:hypothetical protein
MQDALTKANLPLATPSRGESGKAGDFKTPGARVANIEQQAYFADVATKIVLPMFKARNKPFVLVFWSRDPDGTQHNTGDSLNTITPGINGPTALAGIKNADNNLGNCARRWMISVSRTRRTSSSRPITASPPSRREQDQPLHQDDL